MSVAAPIVLRPGDESKLRTVLRCSTAGAGVAQRARIVLLAAEGVSNAEIGRRVGVSSKRRTMAPKPGVVGIPGTTARCMACRESGGCLCVALAVSGV